MKIKTSELLGPALDWCVAKCDGRVVVRDPMALGDGGHWIWEDHGVASKTCFWRVGGRYSPSTDWSQGGPILDKEDISVWISDSPELGKWAAAGVEWMSLDIDSEEFEKYPDPYHGSTPLIAICRCYVASKLGDEVEVPDELLNKE